MSPSESAPTGIIHDVASPCESFRVCLIKPTKTQAIWSQWNSHRSGQVCSKEIEVVNTRSYQQTSDIISIEIVNRSNRDEENGDVSTDQGVLDGIARVYGSVVVTLQDILPEHRDER